MNKIKKFRYKLKWKLISKYYKKLIKPGSKVIDIGAGDLYISKLIQDSCKCKVVGTDIIDFGTNYVKKVIIHDHKLPFKDNSFDYAVIIEVLHHVEHNKQMVMLQEVKRVANQIIILEDAPNFLTRFIDRFHNEGKMPVPLAFRKKNEWIKFLGKLGNVEYVDIPRPFFYPLKYYLIIVR